jgi:hypothetical protein
MGESQQYPVLSGESLRRLKSKALFIYESVLDIEVDPAIYGRMFGYHPESVYGFLRAFPVIVSATDSKFGRFGWVVTDKGNLVLKVIERGERTAELEEMLGRVQ